MKHIFYFSLAGLFMNFGYPEFLYQFNSLRYNDSLIEKLNKIDINDLILNSQKYVDNLGNFNFKEIEVSLKQNNKVSDIPSDEVLSTLSLSSIPGARNKIFANAFGQDPEFFAFYRAMQAYEKALIGGET